MKVKHIDHIGIAVKSIETAGKFYTDFLGLKIQDEETVEEQKVNVGFIPITDSEVELLESTEPDGPVAKFIEKKGEGVQHIAFAVDNLDEEMDKLVDKGVGVIVKGKAPAAFGSVTAHFDTRQVGDFAIQLIQE